MQTVKDSFLTIAAPSSGEFRDRGSKFLAYAFPVRSDAEWQARLEEVRKEHPKARHYCYAFRLGLDGNTFRANDDGEPSGTAGRPILGQIDSFGLTNIFIVVVRYFGGTLLGTSGLIQAYKTSAMHALEQAAVVEKIVEDVFLLTFDYTIMSDVMNAVKKLELAVIRQEFDLEGKMEVAIRQAAVQSTMTHLKALIARVSLEQAENMETVEGLKVALVGRR